MKKQKEKEKTERENKKKQKKEEEKNKKFINIRVGYCTSVLKRHSTFIGGLFSEDIFCSLLVESLFTIHLVK